MPLFVQWDEEQVHLFQGFQRCLSVNRPGWVYVDDSLAKRSAQTTQDRGLQQKGIDIRRLLLEYLFDQVVHHVVMTACEGRDETMNILAVLHGKSSQLQACDPSLGSRLYCGEVVGR